MARKKRGINQTSRIRVRVRVCPAVPCSHARASCVQRIYAVCLQPLFGATAVLPPTRFCRESCAYCVCRATLLARTCHFPFSKSILAPCAPPAGSVNDVDASLRPLRQGCAPTNRRHSCLFFLSLLFFPLLSLFRYHLSVLYSSGHGRCVVKLSTFESFHFWILEFSRVQLRN